MHKSEEKNYNYRLLRLVGPTFLILFPFAWLYKDLDYLGAVSFTKWLVYFGCVLLGLVSFWFNDFCRDRAIEIHQTRSEQDENVDDP